MNNNIIDVILQEDSVNFKNIIKELKEYCKIISLIHQEDIYNELMFNTYIPKRVEHIPDIMMHIKDKLDIRCKSVEKTKEIISLRQFIINVSLETKDLSNSIKSENNILIKACSIRLNDLIDNSI